MSKHHLNRPGVIRVSISNEQPSEKKSQYEIEQKQKQARILAEKRKKEELARKAILDQFLPQKEIFSRGKYFIDVEGNVPFVYYKGLVSNNQPVPFKEVKIQNFRPVSQYSGGETGYRTDDESIVWKNRILKKEGEIVDLKFGYLANGNTLLYNGVPVLVYTQHHYRQDTSDLTDCDIPNLKYLSDVLSIPREECPGFSYYLTDGKYIIYQKEATKIEDITKFSYKDGCVSDGKINFRQGTTNANPITPISEEESRKIASVVPYYEPNRKRNLRHGW